jgi:hypothetical protein
MTARRRTVLLGAAGAVTALLLGGCTTFQDVFQTGEREFTFETAAEAEASDESFRFQGFLPDDATDIRLVTQLDDDETVMRWNSPTVFSSEHCDKGTVASSPGVDPEWLPASLPDEGSICGSWTVVRDGDTQYAWNQAKDT